MMFELPGFTTASAGTEQSSLDALRNACATSYYKVSRSLWVKVVSTGDIRGSGPGRGPGPGDSLQVSRSVRPVDLKRSPRPDTGGFFLRGAIALCSPAKAPCHLAYEGLMS